MDYRPSTHAGQKPVDSAAYGLHRKVQVVSAACIPHVKVQVDLACAGVDQEINISKSAQQLQTKLAMDD